jgi:CheY-like chemotaxis protein
MQSEVNHRGSGVIIVMDDEELLRRAVGVILTILGYTPEFAVNGKEALEIFITLTKSRRRLAGLILDLTIPGGTGGKETVAEIRKLDPDIPVFVASGYADDHVMQNPSGYGFTASIRKPFVMSELAEMLSKYLKNEK